MFNDKQSTQKTMNAYQNLGIFSIFEALHDENLTYSSVQITNLNIFTQ